jgi:hypothetical protein
MFATVGEPQVATLRIWGEAMSEKKHCEEAKMRKNSKNIVYSMIKASSLLYYITQVAIRHSEEAAPKGHLRRRRISRMLAKTGHAPGRFFARASASLRMTTLNVDIHP